MKKRRLAKIKELQGIMIQFTTAISNLDKKLVLFKDVGFKLKLLNILMAFNDTQLQFINLLSKEIPKSFRRDVLDINFEHIIQPLKDEQKKK